VAVGHREAGSVCAWALKYVLEGRRSSIRHCWLDIRSLDILGLTGYMRMGRHCSIDLERLVAYLDLEHTLDAWYRHTSPTNSGRPGTILLPAVDYSQCMHHRRQKCYAQSRRYWAVVARGCWCRYMRFASHSVSSRFRNSRLRVDPFVVRSCLWLELERIGNGEIGENPKWREWEIWRALGG